MLNNSTKTDNNLKKIHSLLLQLMKEIHAFCEKNNIKYSLTGGSLLGAVRHNGFIPWDDDFDMMMCRSEFEKLKKIIEKEKKFKISREQWLYFIELNQKNLGFSPHIDIFIFDRCPNNIIIYEFKIFLLKVLQGMLKEKIDYNKFSLFYKICSFLTFVLGKFINKKNKLLLYDAISKIGNSKDSNYIFLSNDAFSLITLKHSNKILNNVFLKSFEDTHFYITDMFDEYLSNRYGDYMIPRKNKSKQTKEGE